MIYTDKTPIPFGAHYGKPMEDVPDGYLLYFWNERREWLKERHFGVYNYIKDNLDSIKVNVANNRYYNR